MKISALRATSQYQFSKQNSKRIVSKHSDIKLKTENQQWIIRSVSQSRRDDMFVDITNEEELNSVGVEYHLE